MHRSRCARRSGRAAEAIETGDEGGAQRCGRVSAPVPSSCGQLDPERRAVAAPSTSAIEPAVRRRDAPGEREPEARAARSAP